MNIDVTKTRADLASLVERIRDLKRRRTESRQPRWTADDARDLIWLKREATLTCVLLAHRRNRLHLRSLGNLEKQAALLGEWWKRYALPGEEAA